MEAIQKQFLLQNLTCGHCAAEIEREAGRLSGVVRSNVDFVTKTLTLELADADACEGLLGRLESVTRRHDAEIELQEIVPAQPGKKTLWLQGLDCPDCARKIEDAVRGIAGVGEASLDFVNRRLTVGAADQTKLPAILREVAGIVLELEPDVKVSYTERAEQPDAAVWKAGLPKIALAAGAVLFAAGLVLSLPRPAELALSLPRPAELALFLASFLLAGGGVVLRALRNILKGRVFDENFLMSVATIGAFAIGDYPEGVAVMLFYQVGELLQSFAVNRSRRSISALMDIRPDAANLLEAGEIRRVSPEEVGVGDRIVVRPGEKIPLDGRIAEGKSALDTSALTGESMPRDVAEGDTVLSGSVNKGGLLTVEVTREFGESTVSKILDLVQNAGSRKAPTETFISKFARVYTPIVVFAALALALLPPLLLPGASFASWINRGLIFLVVSCPCALVVSIPLSFFGGIGAASKHGILIKGGNFLEALNRVDTVVFDKTGTLTKGSFAVTEIHAEEGFSKEQLLDLAAHAESFSGHPIALSVREAYGKAIDAARVSEYEEIAGHGVRVRIDGRPVLAGSARLLQNEGVGLPQAGLPGTVVYLAVGGIFAGAVVIADTVKPDSAAAIRRLKAAGVRKTVMLTGDSRAAADSVGKELGLDEIHAGLLPGQKVEQMERLAGGVAPGGTLVFVGDGINDAPVLARADVGVAMGALGSDAAIEAADVVLMTDEPTKLADAVSIARRTRRIVWQNIVFALGVKAVFLALGALGIATMWEAVFGDVGVTVLAVLNAARAMRAPK